MIMEPLARKRSVQSVRRRWVLVSFPLSSHNERLLKMLSTVSPLGAQHKRDSAENKLESSLVLFLRKEFHGIPSSRERNMMSVGVSFIKCRGNQVNSINNGIGR